MFHPLEDESPILGKFFEAPSKELSQKSIDIAEKILTQLDLLSDRSDLQPSLHKIIPLSPAERLTPEQSVEIGQHLATKSSKYLLEVALHIQQTQGHKIFFTASRQYPEKLKELLLLNYKNLSREEFIESIKHLSQKDKFDLALKLTKEPYDSNFGDPFIKCVSDNIKIFDLSEKQKIEILKTYTDFYRSNLTTLPEFKLSMEGKKELVKHLSASGKINLLINNFEYFELDNKSKKEIIKTMLNNLSNADDIENVLRLVKDIKDSHFYLDIILTLPSSFVPTEIAKSLYDTLIPSDATNEALLAFEHQLLKDNPAFVMLAHPENIPKLTRSFPIDPYFSSLLTEFLKIEEEDKSKESIAWLGYYISLSKDLTPEQLGKILPLMTKILSFGVDIFKMTKFVHDNFKAVEGLEPEKRDAQLFVEYFFRDHTNFQTFLQKLNPAQRFEMAQAIVRKKPESVDEIAIFQPSEAQMSELYQLSLKEISSQLKKLFPATNFVEDKIREFLKNNIPVHLLLGFPEIALFSSVNIQEEIQRGTLIIPPEFETIFNKANFNENALKMLGHILLETNDLTSSQKRALFPVLEKFIENPEKDHFDFVYLAIQQVRNEPSFSFERVKIPPQRFYVGVILHSLNLTKKERNLVEEYLKSEVIDEDFERSVFSNIKKLCDKSALTVSEKQNIMKIACNLDKNIPLQERAIRMKSNLDVLSEFLTENDVSYLKTIHSIEDFYLIIEDLNLKKLGISKENWNQISRHFTHSKAILHGISQFTDKEKLSNFLLAFLNPNLERYGSNNSTINSIRERSNFNVNLEANEQISQGQKEILKQYKHKHLLHILRNTDPPLAKKIESFPEEERIWIASLFNLNGDNEFTDIESTRKKIESFEPYLKKIRTFKDGNLRKLAYNNLFNHDINLGYLEAEEIQTLLTSIEKVKDADKATLLGWGAKLCIECEGKPDRLAKLNLLCQTLLMFTKVGLPKLIPDQSALDQINLIRQEPELYKFLSSLPKGEYFIALANENTELMKAFENRYKQLIKGGGQTAERLNQMIDSILTDLNARKNSYGNIPTDLSMVFLYLFNLPVDPSQQERLLESLTVCLKSYNFEEILPYFFTHTEKMILKPGEEYSSEFLDSLEKDVSLFSNKPALRQRILEWSASNPNDLRLRKANELCLINPALFEDLMEVAMQDNDLSGLQLLNKIYDDSGPKKLELLLKVLKQNKNLLPGLKQIEKRNADLIRGILNTLDPSTIEYLLSNSNNVFKIEVALKIYALGPSKFKKFLEMEKGGIPLWKLNKEYEALDAIYTAYTIPSLREALKSEIVEFIHFGEIPDQIWSLDPPDLPIQFARLRKKYDLNISFRMLFDEVLQKEKNGAAYKILELERRGILSKSLLEAIVTSPNPNFFASIYGAELLEEPILLSRENESFLNHLATIQGLPNNLTIQEMLHQLPVALKSLFINVMNRPDARNAFTNLMTRQHLGWLEAFEKMKIFDSKEVDFPLILESTASHPPPPFLLASQDDMASFKKILEVFPHQFVNNLLTQSPEDQKRIIQFVAKFNYHGKEKLANLARIPMDQLAAAIQTPQGVNKVLRIFTACLSLSDHKIKPDLFSQLLTIQTPLPPALLKFLIYKFNGYVQSYIIEGLRPFQHLQKVDPSITDFRDLDIDLFKGDPSLLGYLLSDHSIYSRAIQVDSKNLIPMLTLDRQHAPGKIVSPKFNDQMKVWLENPQFLKAIQRVGIDNIDVKLYNDRGENYLKYLEFHPHPALNKFLSHDDCFSALEIIDPPPSKRFIERVLSIAVYAKLDDLAELLAWISKNPSKGEGLIDLAHAHVGHLAVALDLIRKHDADPSKWDSLLQKADSSHALEIQKGLKGESVEEVRPLVFTEIPNLDSIQAKLDAIKSEKLDPMDELHALINCLTFELSNLMGVSKMPKSDQLDRLFTSINIDLNSECAVHIKVLLKYLRDNPSLAPILLGTKMNQNPASAACQIVREMFGITDPDVIPTHEQAQIASLSAFLNPLRQEKIIGSCFGTGWSIYLQLHPELCERVLKDNADLLIGNCLERNVSGKHEGTIPFPMQIRLEKRNNILIYNPLLKAQENCRSDMAGLTKEAGLYDQNLAMFMVKDVYFDPTKFRSFFSDVIQQFNTSNPSLTKVEEIEVLKVMREKFVEFATGSFKFSEFSGWVLKRRDVNGEISFQEVYKQFLTDVVIKKSIESLRTKPGVSEEYLTLLENHLIQNVNAKTFPEEYFNRPSEGGHPEGLVTTEFQYRGETEFPFLKAPTDNPEKAMEFFIRFCDSLPEKEKDSFLENPEMVHPVIYRPTKLQKKIDKGGVEKMVQIPGHAFNIKPAAIIKMLREGVKMETMMAQFSAPCPIKMSALNRESLLKFLQKFPNGESISIDEIQNMTVAEFGEKLKALADFTLTYSTMYTLEKEFLSLIPDTEKEKVPIQMVGDLNWENDKGKTIYLGYGKSLLFGQSQFYRYTKDRSEVALYDDERNFMANADWSLMIV